MNYQPQHPLEPGTHSEPNETRRTRELERGQAIVLIAFVMVGLIAMLGLSVDGGGILFLYRDARNATDAATLAAAYARCTNGDLEEAGLKTARDNGFNNDRSQNFVEIDNPPTFGVGVGDSDYINVRIRAFKPSYFIQIVYPESLWISTEATGFCRKPFSSSTLGAIFGLGTGCQQSGVIELSGSNQTIIGDLFSNADTKQTGSSSGMTIDGSAQTVTSFDPPNYSSKVHFEPGGTYTPGVDPRDNPFSWVDIDDYRPGGIIFDALDALNPDQVTYHSTSWNPGNGAHVSGFHFVEGSVDLKQITVDNTIGLTVVATGKIVLNNPNSDIKYYEPLLTLNDIDIPSIGFLFYSEDESVTPDNQCSASEDVIDFRASDFNVSGVLYAPRANISASHSKGTYIGALIGWRVSLSGSNTRIERDPDLFPPQPPRVSIAQ